MISGEYPFIAELLLIVGLVLDFVTLAAFVCSNFIERSLLVKHTKRNLFTAFIFIILLLDFIVSGIFILWTDKAVLWLGIPYAVLSAVLLAIYIWFYCQLNDSEMLSIEVLETIVGVIEAGDPNLEGHSLNVHNLSMLLYDYLPFKYKRQINQHSLQYASLLLDVGKLGIPRAIIQKPGKLSREEYAVIQSHPAIGVALLNGLPNFSDVRRWIECHHERVDGNGYLHLSEEQIPLASRLLAVTDTYSAITMERSYKASLPYEEAIAELKQAAGTQLDREMVELFCSIPLKRITECLENAKSKMRKYESGDFK